MPHFMRDLVQKLCAFPALGSPLPVLSHIPNPSPPPPTAAPLPLLPT